MSDAGRITLTTSVRAAVASADITDLVSLETRGGRHRGAPARPGRLTGRVLMLTDESTETLLVVLDLLELYEPWLDRFRAVLTRFTDVPPERILVWCNHIHAASSSDGIAEWPLADRLGEAIVRARSEYAAVEVARASRDLGGGWTMRRRFAIDDLETFCVMFNDDCRVDGDRLEVSGQVRAYLAGKGVEPAAWSGHAGKAWCESPEDARLELLDLRRRDNGRPLATWIRFPAHPAIASATKIGNALHPDYIGALREQYERACGGTVFYVQGPCGDIRPLSEEYGMPAAEAFGRRLACQAVEMVTSLRHAPLLEVAMATEQAPLSLRPEYGWSGEQLACERRKVAAAAAATRDPRERLRLLRRAEVLRWVYFHEHDRPTIIPADARASLAWPVGVSALRFNDHLLVGLPGEIFAATGVALREQLARAGFADALVTELCGPYANYVSPPGEYGTGGYEDTCCFLTEGAAEALIAAALRAAR